MDSQPNVTPEIALGFIELLVHEDTPTDVDRIVIGLFDCFAEDLLPVLFPDTSSPPTPTLTDGIQSPLSFSNTLIMKKRSFKVT